MTTTITNRDRLFEEYKYLVSAVISKMKFYAMPIMDHDDIYQYGMIGLWKAIDTFKPNKGRVFKSYAFKKIHNTIIDALRHHTKWDIKQRYGSNFPEFYSMSNLNLEHIILNDPNALIDNSIQSLDEVDLDDFMLMVKTRLSKEEMMILQRNIINGTQMIQVMKEIGRSEKWAHKLKKRVLNKLNIWWRLA